MCNRADFTRPPRIEVARWIPRERSVLVLVLWISIAAALLCGSGCHRSKFRRQADAEAMRLIEQKQNSPHWQLDNYTPAPEAESRMAQPFSVDHPPMPPDDPYSHRFMECVDHKRGYPLWHANGDTWYVENPEWLYSLPYNDQGAVSLDLTSAVQLARTHSRDYQFQKEELYLSALDVSLERFAFDSQLFFGYGSSFTTDGPERATGASSQLEATTGARGLRLEKLGATGSTLVVGFANSLLWEYSGDNVHSATTLIDFSLIQPLLQRAGRERILEELTDAERTLLGNVRQLERYRRGFYLEITSGRSAGSGVSRSGNFISGNAGGGAGGAGGLIGLLRDLQNIQIQQANVASLRSFLNQFREFNLVGRVDQLQVQQSESALYAAQDSLIQAQNNYETNLDRFKILLGLPPELPVAVEDPLLDQFELIDRDAIRIQNDITELQRRAGERIISIEDRRTIFLVPPDSDNRITDLSDEGLFWSDEDLLDLNDLQVLLEEARALNQKVMEQTVPRARADVERLRQSLSQRSKNLQLLRDRLENPERPGTYSVEPEILDVERLLLGPDERSIEIDTLETGFQQIATSIEAIEGALDQYLTVGGDLPPRELYRLLYADVLQQIPKQLTELSGRFLELSLVLVRTRTDTIMRTPIELDPELAIEIARRNRRDWMNARADLVDAWRQIEFAADDLESGLDLVFEGDLSNTGDNPLRLRGTTGRLRAGFQFDAPFTRLLERNQYREVLIQYDRTRRQYYAFEDEAARSLREIIRNLEQNKISFELSRRSILVAVAQVELARFNLIRPPAPGAARTSLGATTARDLTDALSRLQNAQLSFLNVWVNYEVLRRTLDFELGTMALDERGMWLDPGPITAETSQLLLDQSFYSEGDVGPSWIDELSLNYGDEDLLQLPDESQNLNELEQLPGDSFEPIPLEQPSQPDQSSRNQHPADSANIQLTAFQQGSGSHPVVERRQASKNHGEVSRRMATLRQPELPNGN